MITELVDGVLAGNRRAVARLLTIVENGQDEAMSALTQLYPHTSTSWIIGVTGAPGTGKSTLVNALTKVLRRREKSVAIIAVDPTSPFSGGAILGDRIRMRDLSGDKGVFIRSMASRGSLGGLARTTRDMVRVLSAAQFDYVIIETVGAGQSEVEIARTAYTTLVIEAPGLGDDVQAIKAGILEIADILVVNKADTDGAERTERALKAMLELGHPMSKRHWSRTHDKLLSATRIEEDVPLWIPPIICTSAKTSVGIEELVEKMDEHRAYIDNHQLQKVLLQQSVVVELQERLQTTLLNFTLDTIEHDTLAGIIQSVADYSLDPHQAIQKLLEHSGFFQKHGHPSD